MFLALCRGGEHVIFLIFRKFFAEIVCQTKNFSNFILGEHSGNGLNVIIEHYKFNQIIAILLIFKELFISFISNSRYFTTKKRAAPHGTAPQSVDKNVYFFFLKRFFPALSKSFALSLAFSLALLIGFPPFPLRLSYCFPVRK